MAFEITYNSEKSFLYKGVLYSYYNYSLIDGLLVNHNLGEIPHTIEITKDYWAIIHANADRRYSIKLKKTRVL
jgi:hypothetical protein